MNEDSKYISIKWRSIAYLDANEANKSRERYYMDTSILKTQSLNLNSYRTELNLIESSLQATGEIGTHFFSQTVAL